MLTLDCPFLSQETTYDGTQLSPRWVFQSTEATGSAIAFFFGPCHVPTNHLVDLEDQAARAEIHAGRMLHLVGEFFGWSLDTVVVFQHLLLSWIEEIIVREAKVTCVRRGNDLYIHQRKFNVSIVSPSVGSVLFHIGLNVDASGAPVPAIGLRDLGLDEQEFCATLRKTVLAECTHLRKAFTKGRPVVATELILRR